MKALITGASSGIGREIAKVLSQKGYDIIAVARRVEKLEELKNEIKTNVEVVKCDVTNYEECEMLSRYAKDTDILVNCAGFGVFGDFCETSLQDELRMIQTNVTSLHTLTKMFLREFKTRDSGIILNVASIASFFPGPLFSAYYATKAYVLRLSQSIAEELKQQKSNVQISVLCPGPVHTEFSKVANVNFGTGTEKAGKLVILPAKDVAKYAVDKMFCKKQVIIPGVLLRIAVFSRHFLSDKFLAKILYKIQSSKFMIKNH